MDVNIKTSILDVEQNRNISILYACEAGSRAWGFASKNSDYDVRFIYKRPIEWYLSINEGRRDTIDIINDPIDIVGWDIRKALRLLKKSNPALLEWIHSPICYMYREDFFKELKELSHIYYSPKSLLFHYLHMVRGNIREYLKGKDQVWIKKYLYVVRPLLACKWIEMYNTIPPVNFQELYIGVLSNSCIISVNLINDIENLVLRKQQGDELSYGPIIPHIQQFIEIEVERLSQKETQENWPQFNSSKDIDDLNILFRETIGVK